MKKNLTAIFVASSVAVMSLGSTLAAYGADQIGELISSIVSSDVVKPEGSIDNEHFSYAPDTETLTIKTTDSFYEWRDSVPQEFVSIVVIDDSIETVPREAFKGCTSLKKAEFTESSRLNKIEESAFEGCTALEQVGHIYITDYKWNHKLQIAEHAELIRFPSSLSEIGENAFKDCTELKSIYFTPYTINYIRDSAFENCTALTELEIPMGCQQIGNRAFKGCTGIKFLKADNGLRIIGMNAFEGCTDLRYADLEQCYSLEIYDKAFADCHYLWKINLPSGSITIRSKAFYNTYLEGILLKDWWSYDNIDIAGDILECSEEYAKRLKNPTKYIIYSTDNINKGYATLLECFNNFPDSVVVLSFYGQIFDENYNGGTWVSIVDENGNVVYYLTIESELPEEGTVIVPESIGMFPTNVGRIMDKDGNVLDADKYKTTYNPSLMFYMDEDTKTHLMDNVEEPSGGFDFEPEPTPPEESSDPESSDPESSEPESSEPESSESTPPTPPPYYPPNPPESSQPESSDSESSGPESSDPESSELESSEPESSETESSVPESSVPTSSNSEDEFDTSKPTDTPHNSNGSVGSVPNPSDDNPNTGVRFLVPAIFAGAAIVVVATRRRKMR